MKEFGRGERCVWRYESKIEWNDESNSSGIEKSGNLNFGYWNFLREESDVFENEVI